MIRHAVLVALAFLASQGGIASAQSGEPLQRQQHDHTIYILSGDPTLVAKFHENVGVEWEGGVLLEANEAEGVYRYWAYGWRTAPQARQFMMPAMFSGLDLKFETYDDAKAFPELRAELDDASLSCGMTMDAFLILPDRSVTLITSPEHIETQSEQLTCLLAKIRSGEILQGESFGFLGNEAIDPVGEQD